MKALVSMGGIGVFALVLSGIALVALSGCKAVQPTAMEVVQTINCPDCGGTAVLMPAKGAESKEHICLFCKETWKREKAYADSGWVTVCEKCDKVLGVCPQCQAKIKAAEGKAS
jgi:hypothetical protein